MKYGFIRDHHQRFPVSGLCALLSVSKSGFHAWLNRPLRARIRADRQLLIEIRRVHVEHREAHGAVKTWRALNERGIACGKHRVARLRREGSIEAKRRQRQRLTVEHHKTAAPAPDLLVRYFNAPIPNRFWSGDMTFIRTREGWLHRPAPGLIHRTDRGPQYNSRPYREVMAAHRIVPSMNGRKAPQDCGGGELLLEPKE